MFSIQAVTKFFNVSGRKSEESAIAQQPITNRNERERTTRPETMWLRTAIEPKGNIIKSSWQHQRAHWGRTTAKPGAQAAATAGKQLGGVDLRKMKHRGDPQGLRKASGDRRVDPVGSRGGRSGRRSHRLGFFVIFQIWISLSDNFQLISIFSEKKNISEMTWTPLLSHPRPARLSSSGPMAARPTPVPPCQSYFNRLSLTCKYLSTQ